MASLGVSKGIRGGGVMVLGSILSAIIQFFSVIVLSRLISPEDFGLVAMVGVFVALGNLVRDFGLPMTALQRTDLSLQQSSNLFWMNSGLAFFAAGVLAICAPLISILYSEPRLVQIVPAMAIAVFTLGLGAQLQVLLARSMKYLTLVLTDIGSQIAGLAVAILCALGGAGYWALILQNIVVAVLLLSTRWFVAKWKPLKFRRGHGALAMFRSGGEYGIAHLLGFFQNNVDTLIIGATLGATPLGFYNRAYQLLTAPAIRLTSPLTQVVVPTANRVRAEGGSYIDVLLRVQFTLGMVLVFVFSISSGIADILIPLALGSGWDLVVPIFQILAVGGMFSALSNVSYWAFILNGQSRQLMQYNLVTKPMVILFIFVGSFFGLQGVALGYSIGLAMSWPINLIWLKFTAKLPWWKFLKNGMEIVFSGVVTSLSTAKIVELLSDISILGQLSIGLIIGALIYGLVLCVFKNARSNLFMILSYVRTELKTRIN